MLNLPPINPQKKKAFLLTILLFILVFPAVKLVQLSQEIRNKAQELPLETAISRKPLETATISLADNSTQTTQISLKGGAITLSFNKGVLDSKFSKSHQVKFTLLPPESEDKVLRFSIDLEKTQVGGISKVTPTLIETPTLTPTNQPSPTSLLTPFLTPSISASPSVNPVLGEQTEANPDKLTFASGTPSEEQYYTLEYSLSDLRALYALSTFTFIWFNPDKNAWEPVETKIDPEKGTAIAKLNHFSEGGATADRAQVFSPTLKSWETNLYTGSVTHSIPIEVPPGMGGLTPSLSITYNSNLANSLFDEQKGGLLGAGWDLSIPEVRFDSFEHKSDEPCNKLYGSRDEGPQYSLVLGGREYPLAWVGDASDDAGNFGKFVAKQSNLEVKGYYGSYNPGASNPEQFNNTVSSNCQTRKNLVTRWFVRDNSGTEYRFEVRQNGPETANAYDPRAANRKINGKYMPTRYMVNQIKDVSGNIINIGEYQVPDFAKDRVGGDHYFSVYPSLISYNAGKSLISFNIGPKDNPPIPQTEKTQDKNLEKNFELGRINEIAVWSDSTKPTEGRYRTYKFIYETREKLDTLVRIEPYAYGEPSDKNRFVASEFSYASYPVGIGAEALIQNSPWECKNAGEDYFIYGSVQPLRITNRNWQTPGALDWLDDLYQMIFDPSGYDSTYRAKLTQDQKSALEKAGFGACINGNPGENGCPANITNKFYGYDIYYPSGKHCTYLQGSIIYWNKGKAPFLTKVANKYGGEIVFSYENKFTPEQGFNRNVVIAKEIKDTRADTKTPLVKAEYQYEPIGWWGLTNRGGGYGSVTSTDPETQVKTSTFFFPLAPHNGDGGVDPETNPFYGLPLRKVTYKCDSTGCLGNGKTKIFSDEYYLYGISAIKTPLYSMRLDQWWSDTTSTNLMKKGFVGTVSLATETFTPRNADYVEVPTFKDNKRFFVDNDKIGEFIRTESRSWYDEYGRTTKTALYADAPATDAWVNLLNGGKDTPNPQICRHPGSVISGGARELDQRAYQLPGAEGSIDWYSQINTCCCSFDQNSRADNKLKGWNTWLFTYGLPMNVKYFANPQTVDPGVSSQAYFSEIWNPTNPLIGNPGALVRTSYIKYLNDPNFLRKNITSLVEETFASDKDLTSFNDVPTQDRWQITKYMYNDRGLPTEVRKINPARSSERLTTPESTDEIVVKSEYDTYGNVIAQIDPKGNESKTEYYSSGKPYDYILPLKISQKVFDENKNEEKDYLGNQIEINTLTEYNDISWLPTKITDANGAQSKTEYDCLGRLINVYKPDPFSGQVSSLSSVSYFYFDYQATGCGNGEVRKDNPLPHLRVKTRISSTNPDGSENQQTYLYSDQIYDGIGTLRQTQVLNTLVNGQNKALLTETIYNKRGLKQADSLPLEVNPITVTSDTSPAPSYFLDKQNILDPEQPCLEEKRQDKSLIKKAGVNLKKLTCYKYDDLGRILEVDDPLRQKNQTQYAGLTTTIIDANNISKSDNDKTKVISMANALGQTVSTITTNLYGPTEANKYAVMTVNNYDVMGNLINATMKKCVDLTCEGGTQADLSKTEIFYDNLGRKWQINDPDLGVWKYAYDANGNLVKQQDAKNQIIEFKYDSLNRLVVKNYNGPARADRGTARNFIRFVYDRDTDDKGTVINPNLPWAQSLGGLSTPSGPLIGKRVRMWDVTGNSSFSYDFRGRLTRQEKVIDKNILGESGLETSSTSYEYYDSDSLKTTILPTGERVEQVINPYGQLVKTKSDLGEYLKDQWYNRFASPTKSTIGNNLAARRYYDALGRVFRICVGKNCETGALDGVLMNYTIVNRDKVGNILKIKNDMRGGANLDLNYTYDNSYQLLRASGNPYTAQYDYDPEGNMLKKQEGNEVVNMQYTDPLHKHAVTSVNGTNYRYDANGNLLEDEERSYIWDLDNKPVRIRMTKDGIVTVTEFAYDGDGNRVMKRVIKP